LLTVVNFYANALIIKKGIFFVLLKRCLLNDNYEKNNINRFLFLTQLTGYHNHYKY